MIKTETNIHPSEAELAGVLDKSIGPDERARLEEHIALCDECLEKIVSAHESVEIFKKGKGSGIRIGKIMKKMNIYLILGCLSFLFSFAVPRYFIQFLAAARILGIKWVADSKSTKMLVMIYEAWKSGGEKEASRIIETLDSKYKSRF